MRHRYLRVYSRKNNLDAVARNISQSLAPVFTEDLRELARLSGWPSRIIEGISVVAKEDTTLIISYPTDLKEEIEDLEYGPEFGIANTAIRAFLYRCHTKLQSALYTAIPGLIAEVL